MSTEKAWGGDEAEDPCTPSPVVLDGTAEAFELSICCALAVVCADDVTALGVYSEVIVFPSLDNPSVCTWVEISVLLLSDSRVITALVISSTIDAWCNSWTLTSSMGTFNVAVWDVLGGSVVLGRFAPPDADSDAFETVAFLFPPFTADFCFLDLVDIPVA